jgi:phospholipid transport system substrate-binding protein
MVTALAAVASPLLGRFPVHAVTPSAAEAFVTEIVDEIISIIQSASQTDNGGAAFLDLFRRVAALPDIGRFTMGVHWRQMNNGQQSAFIDAFERYAVRAYAKRIGEYTGQKLVVLGSSDMGSRGVLVRSVLRQEGAQDLAIEWLVSDRNGKPQVVDIVAEGVSLAIAQREEFAGMVERRGGDYDRFISDLDGLG